MTGETKERPLTVHRPGPGRRWLTATEDRISQLGPLRAAPAQPAAALAAVQALHAELRAQQPRVDELADCVLVLDDDDDHGTDAPPPAPPRRPSFPAMSQ